LANYTSFQIGGAAKYFFETKTKEDVIKAFEWSRIKRVPFFILGGGSNILVSDEGYNGLVIKFQIPNSKFQINSKFQNSKIIVEAGVLLSTVVLAATENSLTGLEWAAGIPGTVGGAIYGNAGAFGKSMEDIIEAVKVLEIENHKWKIKNLKNKDCKFGYKESIFKKNKNLIIISAIFELNKGDKKEIIERIENFLSQKKKTQPLEFPSAGCVFKNPSTSSAFTDSRRGRQKLIRQLADKNRKLLKKFPELEEFNKKGMIPAGFLIEKCELKGKRIGNAQISQKHANFIINLGKAHAKDVLALIKLIKKEVKNKFAINLEEEIQYLGF